MSGFLRSDVRAVCAAGRSFVLRQCQRARLPKVSVFLSPPSLAFEIYNNSGTFFFFDLCLFYKLAVTGWKPNSRCSFPDSRKAFRTNHDLEVAFGWSTYFLQT